MSVLQTLLVDDLKENMNAIQCIEWLYEYADKGPVV